MEEKEYKIVVYATADKGEGRVMKIGEYDSIEEIEIMCWMFDKNTLISFEYKTDEKML